MAFEKLTDKGTTISTTTQIQSASPAGMITAWVGSAIPDGWVLCDGQELAEADYPDLFANIGTGWNTFNGQAAPAAGNFRVPSFVGLYLRQADPSNTQGFGATTIADYLGQLTAVNGLSNTSSSITGTTDNDTHYHLQTSQHTGTDNPTASNYLSYRRNAGTDFSYQAAGTNSQTWGGRGQSDTHSHSINSGSASAQTISGDTETRPVSAVVSYIIKLYSDVVPGGVAIGEGGGAGGGWIRKDVTFADSPYTASVQEWLILDTSGGPITVNMPTLSALGTEEEPLAYVKFSDCSKTWHTDNVTVVPASGESLNGQAANESLVLDVQGQNITLQKASASNWCLDTNAQPQTSTEQSGSWGDAVSTTLDAFLDAASVISGTYTKNGSLVHCTFLASIDANSTSDIFRFNFPLSNLPFTPVVAQELIGRGFRSGAYTTASEMWADVLGTSANTVYIRGRANSLSAGSWYFSFTYTTND